MPRLPGKQACRTTLPNALDTEYPCYESRHATRLREYIGITRCDDDGTCSQDSIWTAYTGSYENDLNDPGVIWSSRIDWSDPNTP